MSGYVDEVVIPYDRDLGPVLFDHYGFDTARRIAEQSPRDVLEIAAGTGIVTRHLRNLLTKERTPDRGRHQRFDDGSCGHKISSR